MPHDRRNVSGNMRPHLTLLRAYRLLILTDTLHYDPTARDRSGNLEKLV
jgi:hypothetical protein